MQPITNDENLIDSRDIIARIEELTSDDHSSTVDPDELAELRALLAFASDASDYCADWEYGETLIRDSYFTEYAKELAEDLGLPTMADAWPWRCVDWDLAAHELQSDYTAVEFDGVTYWTR